MEIHHLRVVIVRGQLGKWAQYTGSQGAETLYLHTPHELPVPRQTDGCMQTQPLPDTSKQRLSDCLMDHTNNTFVQHFALSQTHAQKAMLLMGSSVLRTHQTAQTPFNSFEV